MLLSSVGLKLWTKECMTNGRAELQVVIENWPEGRQGQQTVKTNLWQRFPV